MVSAAARYKVLDIQNEAPDFIKQDRQLIVEKTHVADDTDIFASNLTNLPLVGEGDFQVNYSEFNDSTGSNLHKINDGDLYVEFTNSTNNMSKRYRISEITTDYQKQLIAFN